ncbi:hypothetical protein CTheo_2079 [Ceratobasidium theobromae]|uniref:Uncharacterized protein n=1 Tax=Ceratobasidium theobromae TaxID=1582974 RepID=A0A5N5QS32_9AGAM|nr:hypothetical protein CTheo_2079 [Ceratobasidium theobromae]
MDIDRLAAYNLISGAQGAGTHGIARPPIYNSQDCIPWDAQTSPAIPAPRMDSRISYVDMTFKGILLPWNDKRPGLIRLQTPGRVDAANNSTDWAIPLTEYLGENTAFGSREITRNVGGEPLRYPLRVFFRDNFLQDGSPPNLSVLNITHGGARHAWAGNIVVLKWAGARRQGYQDMTMGDLHVIAAWLLNYG